MKRILFLLWLLAIELAFAGTHLKGVKFLHTDINNVPVAAAFGTWNEPFCGDADFVYVDWSPILRVRFCHYSYWSEAQQLVIENLAAKYPQRFHQP